MASAAGRWGLQGSQRRWVGQVWVRSAEAAPSPEWPPTPEQSLGGRRGRNRRNRKGGGAGRKRAAEASGPRFGPAALPDQNTNVCQGGFNVDWSFCPRRTVLDVRGRLVPAPASPRPTHGSPAPAGTLPGQTGERTPRPLRAGGLCRATAASTTREGPRPGRSPSRAGGKCPPKGGRVRGRQRRSLNRVPRRRGPDPGGRSRPRLDAATASSYAQGPGGGVGLDPQGRIGTRSHPLAPAQVCTGVSRGAHALGALAASRERDDGAPGTSAN